MCVEFGEFIRKRRKSMGLNQTELGNMFQLHQHTISEYELGHSFPYLDTAEYMIKRLGGELVIKFDETDPFEHELGYNLYQE